MSWWKSLIAVIIQAVAGQVQDELTKPKPVPGPDRRPVEKVGKKDR
jgi:hypothetical protein